jgi:hypothetical protein
MSLPVTRSFRHCGSCRRRRTGEFFESGCRAHRGNVERKLLQGLKGGDGGAQNGRIEQRLVPRLVCVTGAPAARENLAESAGKYVAENATS